MCERRGGVAAAAGRWRWSSVAWRASCRGNAVAPGWSSWTTRRTPSSRHHSSPAPDFRQETAATWRHRTPTTTTTMTSPHFRLTSSKNTPVSAQFKSHLQTLSTATIFPQYFADETRVLSIRYYIIALTLIADAQRDEEAGSVKWIAEITNGNGASSVRKDNQRPSQNENGTAQLGHRTGCRRLRWLGLNTYKWQQDSKDSLRSERIYEETTESMEKNSYHSGLRELELSWNDVENRQRWRHASWIWNEQISPQILV